MDFFLFDHIPTHREKFLILFQPFQRMDRLYTLESDV